MALSTLTTLSHGLPQASLSRPFASMIVAAMCNGFWVLVCIIGRGVRGPAGMIPDNSAFVTSFNTNQPI